MLLILARKYPPATGGMERVSYELARHLSERVEVKLIKFPRNSDAWIPVVYLLFFVRTVLAMRCHKIDAVYLTDAVLSPLGLLIRRIYDVKVVALAHGLDITFDNAVFQRVVPAAMSRMDRVICVSPATQRACLQRRIPATKTVVIPNGTCDYSAGLSKTESRALLAKQLGLNVCDDFLVLSVGRLVRRKGFTWFTENVVPQLIRKRPDARYVVIGDGPMVPHMKRLIATLGLERHVFLLTNIDNDLLKLFYNSADVFVAPNITVPGDMEGFGVVLLEAASCNLPVVGADLEGISDVLPGFGTLVPEGDVDAFVAGVLDKRPPSKSRDYVLRHHSWSSLVDRHLECIESCFQNRMV